MAKIDQKFPKMAKNGQKWRKNGYFEPVHASIDMKLHTNVYLYDNYHFEKYFWKKKKIDNFLAIFSRFLSVNPKIVQKWGENCPKNDHFELKIAPIGMKFHTTV